MPERGGGDLESARLVLEKRETRPGERETRPGERETRPGPMLLSQAQEKPGATSSHLNPVLAFILCKSQCPKEPGKDKELSVFLNTQLS